MSNSETPPATGPALEPPPDPQTSRTPPPRRVERLHLFLAGLVGALCTAVIFLTVLLLRSEQPRTPDRPQKAATSDPGRLASPRAQTLPDPGPGAWPRLPNLGSAGAFTLRLGGEDVDLKLEEDAEAVWVVARVKNAVADKFNIQVQGRIFSLAGERKIGSGGFQGTVSFSQSLTLPADVDPTRMTSEFKDGVLRVRLPKKP
jgi:HSP20 family molecular chaperone IbpA